MNDAWNDALAKAKQREEAIEDLELEYTRQRIAPERDRNHDEPLGHIMQRFPVERDRDFVKQLDQIMQRFPVTNGLDFLALRELTEHEAYRCSSALHYLEAETGRKKGRKAGSEANQKKAQKNKDIAMQLNKDLLSHADTARWTIEQRAKHILQYFEMNKKQTDRSYTLGTIENWITGT